MANSYNPIKCASHVVTPFYVLNVIPSDITCMEEGVAMQMWNYVL